mmetsp:Transcript_53502/g.160099  ORF Transcript_53502/g.160099 Transcript_53502/m.160099 type:complete len:493 (-) Transcript_53502:78-1556(-)
MSPQEGEVRCHFDVLGVPRDADAKTIKKAHRKLALKWHPDKNMGCKDAEHEFKLVQEAYECLSDPAERKWYEEHRESILRGGKGFDGGYGDGAEGDVSFLFDVVPFQYGGCFEGFSDDEGDFYAVYADVFRQIMEGELSGYVSEGNIDETEMPNGHLRDASFGNSSSDWADVSAFYGAWESFNSCLSFAWADKYDPRDAENRRVRRAIDDENRKARRVAKRERQEDVLALVRFVKRRDPRVKEARARMERERSEREAEAKREAERKREDVKKAREAWREESARRMAEAEERDADAGRVRLADLDDDDDFFGGGKKKGKKKKRGKKGKKNRGSYYDDEPESHHEDSKAPTSQVAEEDENVEGSASNDAEKSADADADAVEAQSENAEIDAEKSRPDSQTGIDQEQSALHLDSHAEECEIADYDSYESESEEEEEEPQVWRCECCRKDFKSEGQMQNHMKSKKHKQAWKKYEKTKLKEAKEQAAMEDLLDEMAL